MFYNNCADIEARNYNPKMKFMKSKLNPIYLILGLFLFKVVIIDNFRNSGQQAQARTIATYSSANNQARAPIR